MPIPKGPNCFGDVMKEHKAGQLHSGKGGPVVKSDKQAKAIASSMCYDEGCGGGCGCKSCPRAQGRKAAVMTMGYSEEAADTLVFGQMVAPLGYPTPNFGPEVNEAIMNAKEGKPGLWANIHAKRKRMKRKGNTERKARKGDKGYPKTLDIVDNSEDVEADMAMARIDVMRGRLDELAMKLGMMAQLGEVEMDVWMHDKLTLAADYISAVADNALFGDGIEVEPEED
jgi:hypothetical protein